MEIGDTAVLSRESQVTHNRGFRFLAWSKTDECWMQHALHGLDNCVNQSLGHFGLQSQEHEDAAAANMGSKTEAQLAFMYLGPPLKSMTFYHYTDIHPRLLKTAAQSTPRYFVFGAFVSMPS
jgi:hypothetical protein